MVKNSNCCVRKALISDVQKAKTDTFKYKGWVDANAPQ